MRRSRHKNPPSTFGRYIPGVGRTITRANIDAHQAKLVKEGQEPATPEQIVQEFCTNSKGRNYAKPNHLARAYRLMAKG